MTMGTKPRLSARAALGCLGLALGPLLIIGFVPPQLSSLTSGGVRPMERISIRGGGNGWDELAEAGHQIEGDGRADWRDRNAGLLPAIDQAMVKTIFVAPTLAEYAADGLESYEAVVRALALASAAAEQDARSGRMAAAAARWAAQLRASRSMIDDAQALRTVELAFDRETAICEQVRQAMVTAEAPVRVEDWRQFRDKLAKGPDVGRLAVAWRRARYNQLYAQLFEPETLPAEERPAGFEAWLDRLPPNCFDDPYHALGNYRRAFRRVWREALKPRPERDLVRLRYSLEPHGLNLYDYRGRWLPAEALRGRETDGFDAEDRLIAERRLTDTTIAIRIAHDRDGKLPDNLEQLVGEGLLDEVPIDPFNEWPLRYDPERGLLWSVGRDEVDDGAERDQAGRRRDVVVELGGMD